MSTQVRFRFLSGDVNWQEYGGKFISGPYAYQGYDDADRQQEFAYWLILSVDRLDSGFAWDTPRNAVKYLIGLLAVAPSQVPPRERLAALNSWGIEPDEWQEEAHGWESEYGIDILSSYGCSMHIWEGQFSNLYLGMKQCRQQAREFIAYPDDSLFAMHNRIGASGWDFLRGNPLGWMAQLRQEG